MKKIYTLALLMSMSFLGFSQAPDGFPDIFVSTGGGTLWNDPASWTNLDFVEDFGGDLIPDGDDIVIINHSITVAADAGFGEIVLENGSASTITLTIDPGISLTGYTDYHFANVAVRGLSTSTVFTNLDNNGGTFSCTALNIDAQNSGRAYFKVRNGGTATIDGDITFDGWTTTAVQIQALLGSGNTINFSGNVVNTGVLNLGTNATASTLNFNGTSPQSIPNFGSFSRYSSIEVNNPAGVSLTSNLTNTGSIPTSNMFGSITISSGFLNDAGFNITLPGSFTNNGDDFVQSVGSAITFTGSAARTLGGTATNNWQTLNQTNTVGVTVTGGTHTIREVLNIDAGTFNNSAGSVTLLSDASGTAQLADMGTGSYSGGLTVQRFITKGDQGYVSIASPVQGTTLNDWHDGGIGAGQEFIFTGFPGSDYPNFFGGVFSFDYDETISGTNKNNGFVESTNITNPTGSSNNYKAHYVYADAATYNISVTGVPNQGPVSIPLDYNAAGGAAHDGWNFIGNPYPATIDWESINGGLSNVEDFYSVYSYDAGNFASYEGGGASLNGATRYIPSSQGFWVQATANTTLDIAESDKASSQDPGFIKSVTSDPFKIRLTGDVNGYYDEAIIYAGSNFTNDFDHLDRAKLHTYDPTQAPTLYTVSADGYEAAINRVSNSGAIDIPLMAVSGTSALGNYTLDFDLSNDFLSTACITLEDLHTGAITDLKSQNSYVFASSDTTTVPRFVIHISTTLETDVVKASCNTSADGEFTIEGDNGMIGSNFEVKNESGDIVFAGQATSTSIAVSGLESGVYTVETDYMTACGAVEPFTVTVDALETVDAEFGFTVAEILEGETISNFLNDNSTGSDYLWDFGDGTTSTDIIPTHSYNAEGTYTVTLIVSNGMGCSDVHTETIAVAADIAAGLEDNNAGDLNAYYANGSLFVEADFQTTKVVNLQLLDVSGKFVQSFGTRQLLNQKVVLPVNELSSGMYLLDAVFEGERKSFKVFIQ